MVGKAGLVLVGLVALTLVEGSIRRDADRSNSPPEQPQKILFYRYFTPTKLARAATFIHRHHSLTSRLLTFLSAPKNYYRLMTVPLLAPKVTTANANLVIKMAVGLETKYGQGESDPSFVVSDGDRFIGAITLDKNNYPSAAPCFGIEGDSGPIMMNRVTDASLPKPAKAYYPGRFDIQLSLSDRWGTCFVALNGGFSREMIYQNKLNPRKGLFLEIYGDEKGEKQGIKYIEVNILQEN